MVNRVPDIVEAIMEIYMVSQIIANTYDLYHSMLEKHKTYAIFPENTEGEN